MIFPLQAIMFKQETPFSRGAIFSGIMDILIYRKNKLKAERSTPKREWLFQNIVVQRHMTSTPKYYSLPFS